MNAIVERDQTGATTLRPRAAEIVDLEAGSMMAVLSRAASDPSVDPEKLERLAAVFERLAARNAEQAFNEAMSKTQAAMSAVAADSNNPQTKSKYASYFALDKALRPIYTRNGIALSFGTEEGAPELYVRVVCFVTHGGYTRRYHVDMPADGKGAKGGDVMTRTHAMGAAMSYGQRYLLKMIFNIAVGGDDDGNGAASIALITSAQDDTLKKMLAARSNPAAALEKFLGIFKVESTADLPAAEFDRAVRLLTPQEQR